VSERLRLGFIGTGWISDLHLPALEHLGRTSLVGVVSRSADRAGSIASRWGGAPFTEVPRMLDEARPDVVYVCLPPNRAPAACELLIERRTPFLTEKPLAATAVDAARVGAALARARASGGPLVVAVGYQWRALDFLPLVRERLAARPPRLVLGRWTGGMPLAPWWRHVAESGGQVVEQATHLYDLARWLVGEADVVAASSGQVLRPAEADADVDALAAALLRFRAGAVGSFVNASILASGQVELDLLSDGWRTTIRLHADAEGMRWVLTIDDGAGEQVVATERDPYEVQAETFLDAVVADDPAGVLSSFEDALLTDRLVRAVVGATGTRG
jgi:myo-inositol 2-dehydrogenase/D-chiro-inositol 1-dehydrogenase